MKAIMQVVPPAWLEERRRQGLDRLDEMWEGVLHMTPIPGNPHQDLKERLLAVLQGLTNGRRRGRWIGERNIALPGGWPDDYRIPDLLYLSPRSRAEDRGTHYEGPPDIVVEIAGPGDESREKLDWYARLGVREVWFLEIDSRRPEIMVRTETGFQCVPPDPRGWVKSEVLPLDLRAASPGGSPTLEIRRRAKGQKPIRL